VHTYDPHSLDSGYVLQLRSSLSQCLVFDTGDVGRVELQRKTKIQMSVTREGFVVY